VQGKYDTVVDRESAYEVLRARAERAERAAREAAAAAAAEREAKEQARQATKAGTKKKGTASGAVTPARVAAQPAPPAAAVKPATGAAPKIEQEHKGGFIRGILGGLLGRGHGG
jgi:hypothetical protein